MKTCEEWARDIEAKIESEKTKRKERNNMKNKYMKLGAVAACLVLVIGAAAVIPYVANRNESANLPETTVAATAPAQTGDAVGGGESSMCKVHPEDYHSIPGMLIEYVGQEKMDEWREKCKGLEGEDGCPWYFSLINFVKDFDIPYEVFVVKAELTGHPSVDAELLYFGTDEEIEEHFRDLEKFAKDYIKTEHLLKLGFNLEEKYADKLTEYADRTVMFSIPELVVYGGITKDELIKAIDEVSENIYEKFGEVYTFDYDIDGLYPDGVATLYDAYAKDDESVYDRVSRLDALFCGLIE